MVRSYHSNLLGYGPLANTFLEGPVEEIAGPWRSDSDPNPPYDSHQVSGIDLSEGKPTPPLRVIYWGGVTENYIYTEAENWGTESTEWAHYIKDDRNNDDLYFPAREQSLGLKKCRHRCGWHHHADQRSLRSLAILRRSAFRKRWPD